MYINELAWIVMLYPFLQRNLVEAEMTSHGFVRIDEASKSIGVHPNTLRSWGDKQYITVRRTPGGQRRYALDELRALLESRQAQQCNGQSTSSQTAKNNTLLYARVSSAGQRNDLERQCERLQSEYPDGELIRDIGSGLNFKRRGLRTVLDRVMRGRVKTVVVAHRDRLARFGIELIEWICRRQNTTLVVLDHQLPTSDTSELAEDLTSIVQVFSARLYGKRRYNRKQGKKNSNVEDSHSSVEATKTSAL
jgi:predicted site-specific integrase-resolvase